VAETLSLDLNNTHDKAKVRDLLKIWLAAGSLRIVDGQDDTRRPRKYVEVREDD